MQVVNADSAKIGVGHEEVGSIPANHSGMTKFQGEQDTCFRRVVAQIRRWVLELSAPQDVDIEGEQRRTIFTAKSTH